MDASLQDTNKRVDAIVTDVLKRRRAGETLPDGVVLAQHPDIAEQLRAQLVKADQPTLAPEDTKPLSAAPKAESSPETVDHSAAGSESPVEVPSRPTFAAANAALIRFNKKRRHAAGGMGQVWLAVDGEIRREVALKDLKPERADDPIARERFLAEGYITGALEHPGVVPVYGLGIDAQHRPYYAMRFVRGESMRRAIKDFHDSEERSKFSRNNLKFRELLGRFTDLCLTITYAHSRGVLHRDLKPDNVMLGKYGETYVVDWGMARVMGSRAEEYSIVSEEIVRPAPTESNSGTRYGSAMGTPGYMSPEQAEGLLDQLTAATDIYALGAVLYCLLTNRSPIEVTNLTEFFRKVKIGEFPPPQEVNPKAPKELCLASLKALSTSPSDRYSSARQIAAEVDRWLADEPLLAAPENALQRVARLTRSHYRWLAPLVAATTLIAFTAIWAAASINSARATAVSAAEREANAKRAAQQSFLRARDAVDQWLTGFTEASPLYPVADRFRLTMFEQAANHYEQLLKQAKGLDPADMAKLQLEAARTQLRLGDVRRQMGEVDSAFEAYETAVEVFGRFSRSSPGSLPAIDGLAQSHGRLALVHADRGEVKQENESYQHAIKIASNAAQTQSRLPRQSVAEPTTELDADSTNIDVTLADLQINYAGSLAIQDRLPEAQQLFTSVVDRMRMSASREAKARSSMALAQLGLGQVLLRQGRALEARTLFEEASDLLETESKFTSETLAYLQLVANAKNLLAIAQGQMGNLTAEAEAYSEILATYAKLERTYPNAPRLLFDKSRVQIDLGQTQFKLGQLELAEENERAAESILTLLTSAFPEHQRLEAHGLALDLLGHVVLYQGNNEEAVGLLQTAADELKKLAEHFPEASQYRLRLATSEAHLGQALAASGLRDEAMSTLAVAANHLDSELATTPDDPALHYAAGVVASIDGATKLQFGDNTRAEEAFDAAGVHFDRLVNLSSDAEYLAAAAWHLGTCPLESKRDPKKATELISAALKQSSDNGSYVVTLALCQLRGDRLAESEETLKKLDSGDLDPLTSIMLRFVTALGHHAREESEEALDDFRSAVSDMDKSQPGNWELKALRRQCAEALGATDA